jgi:hypothetical protein
METYESRCTAVFDLSSNPFMFAICLQYTKCADEDEVILRVSAKSIEQLEQEVETYSTGQFMEMYHR